MRMAKYIMVGRDGFQFVIDMLESEMQELQHRYNAVRYAARFDFTNGFVHLVPDNRGAVLSKHERAGGGAQWRLCWTETSAPEAARLEAFTMTEALHEWKDHHATVMIPTERRPPRPRVRQARPSHSTRPALIEQAFAAAAPRREPVFSSTASIKEAVSFLNNEVPRIGARMVVVRDRVTGAQRLVVQL